MQDKGRALRYPSANRGLPAGNPIASALVIVVGTLAIGASILLGFLAFVVLGSIILVIAGIVGMRLWWFNRRLRKNAGSRHTAAAGHEAANSVIEGEYRVVHTDSDDDGS